MKIVIVEENLSEEKLEQIKNNVSDKERGIVIVDVSKNSENKILFPTDVPEEEILQIQIDGKSISEHIQAYHNLQKMQKVAIPISNIRNITLTSCTTHATCVDDFAPNSKFYPERYGSGFNPHKAGRNQKIIRR